MGYSIIGKFRWYLDVSLEVVEDCLYDQRRESLHITTLPRTIPTSHSPATLPFETHGAPCTIVNLGHCDSSHQIIYQRQIIARLFPRKYA